MEVLKEIAYTLTRYQVRQVDVITNPELKNSRKENRYWEAYVGLREQRWADDASFAAGFGLKYPSKNYNRFKNELKDRLWNTLLFTEGLEHDQNEYIAAYHDVLQKWAVTEVLKHRSAYKAYRELSWRCLSIAQKFEFVKLTVDITESLKSHFFLYARFKKEYLTVKTIFDESWPVYQADVEIRNAYEEFVTRFVTVKGYKKDQADLVESTVEAFRERAARINTIDFQFHFRVLHFYSRALRHDWLEALAVADDTLAYFKTKPFTVFTYTIGFNHQKASCLLMLGRHEEARVILDDSLLLTAADSSHHFKNRELAAINSIYQENYQDAWELCKSAIRHDRFDRIPLIDQETWRIYYGYLYFLANSGRLKLSPKETAELPRFRLSSWLNDLPLYNLDKRGAQIPVLILQSLLLLSENRWDELENRLEALRKFRQRNLDPADEHYRTNCFIRLLELLPRYTSNLSALPKAALPWLEKMSLADVDILDRTYEIEVVPYERQWAWIEEICSRGNHNRRE